MLSLIVLSAATACRIERDICDHRAGATVVGKDSCRRAAEHSSSWRKVEGAEHAVHDSRREQRGQFVCTPRPLRVRTGQRRAQTRPRGLCAAGVPGGNGTSQGVSCRSGFESRLRVRDGNCILEHNPDRAPRHPVERISGHRWSEVSEAGVL